MAETHAHNADSKDFNMNKKKMETNETTAPSEAPIENEWINSRKVFHQWKECSTCRDKDLIQNKNPHEELKNFEANEEGDMKGGISQPSCTRHKSIEAEDICNQKVENLNAVQTDQIIERHNSTKSEESHYRSEGEESVWSKCTNLVEKTMELDCKANEIDSKVDEMSLGELCSDVNALLVEEESNMKRDFLENDFNLSADD